MSVSAELQPVCLVKGFMLASAQEDIYLSGLMPSVGPLSQRQGSLHNCPLLVPRYPSLNCASKLQVSSSHTTWAHTSLQEVEVRSLCEILCCPQLHCCSMERGCSTTGQPSRNGHMSLSSEASRPWAKSVTGTEIGKAQRVLSMFGVIPSRICHLIMV